MSMAEGQATNDVSSKSGSPARKQLTPWSPINIQAMAEQVAWYLAAAGRRLKTLAWMAQLVSHFIALGLSTPHRA